MNILAFERYMDSRIPPSLSCEWDNDGRMLLADPMRTLHRVLIALDATEAVVKTAISGSYDLILTHHPLVFRALRCVDDPRLLALIRAGISVYSYHTRLDCMHGGVNDALAECIGISDVEPFGEDGMGRIGNLSAPLSSDDFAEMLKNKLSAPRITSFAHEQVISRVAVVGGAGKDFLSDAIRSGAEAFVTGEVGYNALLEAENRIGVFCAGHYYTEQPVCQVLARLTAEAIPDAQITITMSCPLREY